VVEGQEVTGRWRVRRWPKCREAHIWEVFEPDGSLSGAFETWAEAMRWATSISARLEYFLENAMGEK
jgi:hypothetical protein